MTNYYHDQMSLSRLNKKLEAAAWGLFFMWTGVAVFTHIGWAAGLIGVGIIILGAQTVRKYFALKLETFWVALGILFLVGGICRGFNVHLGFVPILCIAAGRRCVSVYGG